MFDSFGDGWNGNTYTITDSTGAVMATGGLTGGFGTPGGAYGVDSLCLPNGCYTITVGGGSWQSEVSFNFGSLLGAGVGTYTNVCFPVTGCTDTAATNYSPAATVDDGSCSMHVLLLHMLRTSTMEHWDHSQQQTLGQVHTLVGI